MVTEAVSPASSGPSGSHFEGQVGAHYLLSMLLGADPRGLPGTSIDRIEFQRAGESRHLDDVIVHAHDLYGEPSVLEIQVKRKITFAPGDPVFRKVVGQIVDASRRPDFWTISYELAIATAKTSQKIDGAYQDLLTWARQIGDATTFMDRIERPGSANDDMRTFVRTFKSHLQEAGSPDDNETTWKLLRKLQILVFDFTATGSASEEIAKERALRALHPDDASRAGNLWTTLIELALDIAKSGGDRNRDGLIKDFKSKSFRLTGDRRYSTARAALAEDARHALSDISNRVGDVMLTRHERVAAVHAALNNGRYIEIRGDAGVGKSGILKHFAEQMATEARILVLSPDRTTPKGWTAMRSIIGFDGTAHDLLTDLAGDGGAILFVDNLDFFNDEERKTVVDLVREAATVPGFAVVVTARRNFGIEEPNWLPSDVLEDLGCAEPIVIEELSESEVDELRHTAPRLASLLSDNHPARDVTRNLFRLSRLARLSEDEPAPRTEADMAMQWWQTADGRHDKHFRDRARLLKSLAEQTITRADFLNVSDHPGRAVDSLVASETLRDMGGDRVAFRHDVLREWAIANLLHTESSAIDRLPLDHTASAAMARGVELASRMALEHETDNAQWESIIERLSREGVNGSWRRAVLLGIVRSEAGDELLTRLSDKLLAESASMLRELIRIVMAVDVEPALSLFTAIGIDPATVPEGLNIPSRLSWHRLIRWLLSFRESLPAAAIPDVVDLFTAWTRGMLGQDPLTPLLNQWFYQLLTEIEVSRDVESISDRGKLFGGKIGYDQIRTLEADLRTGFLMFCHRTPLLAVDYLRSLGKRSHNDNAVRSILKFRGSLAQAAPAELAELTATALIPKQKSDERHNQQEFEEPFEYLDHKFFPASPVQGPFFDLLTHAPQHGLSLINRLVTHAISFYSRGAESGTNVLNISFPYGDKDFSWMNSYTWSREGAGHSSVTSALMALEAWAHRRIELGESFEEVLAEVLNPPDLTAAYLLVAVDLVLSHWPKSREAAIPFLACPELLCIDRERYTHDTLKHSDIFELGDHLKEPRGAVSVDSLDKRPSRRNMLESLLAKYAVFGPTELLKTLTDLLHRAAVRLGPPNEQSDLRDPAFMVVHALNITDPKNWHEVSTIRDDGTPETVHQYVPPEAESRHLATRREASREAFADINMQSVLGTALEDPSRSSSEFAAAAVEWAQDATTKLKNENDDDVDKHWMREQAVVTAAMMVMRDGSAELQTQHGEWARSIFVQALQGEEDSVHRFRSGLRFNPIAIAFAGMIYSLKDQNTKEGVRALLEVAVRDGPSAAHGFGAAATTLATVDERLPRAVLRCAFTACIRPSRELGLTDEDVAARSEQHREQIRLAVEAELKWLANERSEPDWQTFPPASVRRRRRLQLPGGQAQQKIPASQRQHRKEYTDHQAAALWLNNTQGLFNIVKHPWLLNIARTYAAWTVVANGAELDANEEVAGRPREWNNVYYDLLARCLPELKMPEIKQLALAPISSLPDEPFFDVITRFLRNVDDVYFNDGDLQESNAVTIRATLARRMMTSIGWKRLRNSRSDSIEIHIGPAIAGLFFNNYSYTAPSTCYLLPKGIDRISAFLPVLEKLIESAPTLFVALVTLNLLEASPRSSHLSFLVGAANVWLVNYPDDVGFWVHNDIGHRVCAWIEEVQSHEPAQLDIGKAVRLDVDRFLAAMISLGVADANRLEKALATGIIDAQ